MTTLNDFKALRAQSPLRGPERAVFTVLISNPDAARQRMVELAAEQGVTLTVDQVREFLQQNE